MSQTALDELADLPRWVAWRNEERGGKPTKIPYSPNGRHAKADDPTTWGTRVEADEAAMRLVNGQGGGTGIQLGDVGYDQWLVGIDFDTCIDAGGKLADWAVALLAAIPSYAERSPSGTGVKSFFYVEREDVRPFLDLLGVDSAAWGTRRTIGNSGADHGPAVEIYCGSRYFAVTGLLWEGQPDQLTLLDWPTLERVATLVPPARSKTTTDGPKGDDSRSAIAFRKGIALCRQGKTFDEMCEALRADPETADWYLEKGLAASMRELKRIWEKGAGDSDKNEIAELARLSPLAWERERRAAAKRLGVRATALDKIVRTEAAEDIIHRGRKLTLTGVEPWPEAVDGAALIDAMSLAIRRHVVMSQAEGDVVALWAIAVHAFDDWIIFPRLFITAPEKGCGKTTLLDVVSRLIPKPLMACNVSASALFRVIEAERPSLLLDEADAYMRDDEALRSVIDGGHRRDGCVIRTTGDDYEPRAFSVWAPMAIAAIKHIPGTIEDRSITIRLRRRKPDEEIISLRLDRAGPLDVLARKAARWVKDKAPGVFAAADPDMPQGLTNRAADNWRPLLSVADLAGGSWRQRARKVATELSAEPSESAGVLLLSDLRELFDAEPNDVLFTPEILAKLEQRIDRPWPEWKRGKPITARQLATLLKPFGVPTKNSVRRDRQTGKGYEREHLEDAFTRYLRPCGVTGSQPA